MGKERSLIVQDRIDGHHQLEVVLVKEDSADRLGLEISPDGGLLVVNVISRGLVHE